MGNVELDRSGGRDLRCAPGPPLARRVVTRAAGERQRRRGRGAALAQRASDASRTSTCTFFMWGMNYVTVDVFVGPRCTLRGRPARPAPPSPSPAAF